MRARSRVSAATVSAVIMWALFAAVILVALALYTVLAVRPGWWTGAGVAVLLGFHLGAVACAVVVHWVPRLRGRLRLTHEFELLRFGGLNVLVGLCCGLGLGWLVHQLRTDWEADLWTVLLWSASLPLVLPAVVDRRGLLRWADGSSPTSDVERRAFRTGHRRVGATGRRGHWFGERPRAQESRAEAIDG